MFDQQVTRIPFDDPKDAWASDEVALFRLEEPIMGGLGETAEHVLTSTMRNGEGAVHATETALFVVDEDGLVVGPFPFITASDDDDPIALLASVGLTDVTTEA